jgi:Protein of unknown function (DUF1254)
MANAQTPSPSEVREIAERAYIHAYPLVLMEATAAAMPVNHLTHVATFPDANFRLIVRPNADTFYSTAWIDVSKEPMLLHVALPDAGTQGQIASRTGCLPAMAPSISQSGCIGRSRRSSMGAGIRPHWNTFPKVKRPAGLGELGDSRERRRPCDCRTTAD